MRSLSELIDLGLYHQVVDEGIRASLDVESLDTDDYRDRLAKRDMVRAAVEALLDEHDLTVLIYPTIRQTARPIGQPQPGSNCALSAISGLPAITVPAGYAADGMPVGLEMIGREFAESDLIRLAYAFEQATRHRRAPHSTPSQVTRPLPLAVDVERIVDGVGLRGHFELNQTRRELAYSVSAHGVFDRDVPSTHIHRSRDGAAGPVIHLLGGRGRPRSSGTLTLSAGDWTRLRAGDLYVDVHTTNNVPGLRADIESLAD